MITTSNYKQTVENVGLKNLPVELQEAHAYLKTATTNFKNWKIAGKEFSEVKKLAFEKLNQFVKNTGVSLNGTNEPKYIRQAKKDALEFQFMDTDHLKMIYRLERDAILEGDATIEEARIRVPALEKELKQRDPKWLQQFRFDPEELSDLGGTSTDYSKWKKLFPETNLPNKEDERMVMAAAYDLIAFNLMTRSYEKLIQDGEEFAHFEIAGRYREGYIRLDSVNGHYFDYDIFLPITPLYESFGKKFDLKNYRFQILVEGLEDLPKPLRKKYELKVSKNKVKLPEVMYRTETKHIKRYLELDGNEISRTQLLEFIRDLQNDISTLRIRKRSPLSSEIGYIQNALLKEYNEKLDFNRTIIKVDAAIKKRMVNAVTKSKAVFDLTSVYLAQPYKIKPVEMQGLNGTALAVVPSTTVTDMDFPTIGFTGKWLTLIGDPCSGFTAMVFGKPKMGKSYLAVDFAGYLARNFGKVLYVPKEEKLGATFATKLKEQSAAHPNLVLLEVIPDDLSSFDFIFLDSVNSLNLTSEDLRKLKEKNPGKSFIYIFQTTKGGNFRGENTFQHDVDIVIEIPERGKAVQFGRFNQGGEMKIFEDANPRVSEDLNGTPKKKNYPAWTRPKHLEEYDHRKLKHIFDLYSSGDFGEAFDYALNSCDTIIREEIPGDVWKKIGGTLTNTGEEKLRKSKSRKKTVESNSNRNRNEDALPARIYPKLNPDHLLEFYNHHSGSKLNLGQFQEILEMANYRNVSKPTELINKAEPHLTTLTILLNEALKEYEAKKGEIDNEFDPKEWEKRKDDENPTYLFSTTSTRLLAEAMEDHFNLRDLVKRELANRGLNYYGHWVGFDKAKKELGVKK
jgi:hypothetical protein